MNNKYVLRERIHAINPAVDIYQGDENRKPKGQLRKAAKYLKKCRNGSKKLRDKYQQRIASEEATTNGNADVAKIAKKNAPSRSNNQDVHNTKKVPKTGRRGREVIHHDT
eukprot:7373835-Ditylum_brightwellii.AAC.1